LPSVQTISEQGLKGFEIVAWHGLYAPKGTPSAALDKLNKALRAALTDPDVKARLSDLNVEIAKPDEQTPAALKMKVESEVKKWAPIIKASGGFI